MGGGSPLRESLWIPRSGESKTFSRLSWQGCLSHINFQNIFNSAVTTSRNQKHRFRFGTAFDLRGSDRHRCLADETSWGFKEGVSSRFSVYHKVPVVKYSVLPRLHPASSFRLHIQFHRACAQLRRVPPASMSSLYLSYSASPV